MESIIITGATGLIGKKIAYELHKQNKQVIVFSRDIHKARQILNHDYVYVPWDYKKPHLWQEYLSEADAIIHLAGANIFDKRWTNEFKQEIFLSRVDTTKALVNALKQRKNKLQAFVSASGVGYYGDGKDTLLDEHALAGNDFLAHVCKEWEGQASEVEKIGIRWVSIRTGIVLSSEGGALKTMLPPFQLFVGGPIGSGRQWFPWIHIEDMVGIYLHSLTQKALHGPVNAASPGICTMYEFAQTMGKVIHRPSWFAVPGVVLKFVLGDLAEVILKGQRVNVNKLIQSGYTFKFPHLEQALNNLIKQQS